MAAALIITATATVALGGCGGGTTTATTRASVHTSTTSGSQLAQIVTSGHLTVTQLKQAVAVAAAMDTVCGDELRGIEGGAKFVRADEIATDGMTTFANTLAQDPDTRYNPPGWGSVTSMRQLASSLAALNGSGPVCTVLAQSAQQALQGAGT